ncbi:MAG: peptidylprolyl isomerase [Alphaproteobacteria bacterium]|nr:peptidylprolyl isomerase [Alphaproteobacteria bacterium]
MNSFASLLPKPIVLGLTLAFAISFAAPPAQAAQQRDVEGIAAIVNDKVISLFDVDQRVDLFFATSGIAKSPEMTERLRAQVLRSLVDEKLQLEEANRVEISIPDKDVEDRMKTLATEGKMTLDGIKKFLAEKNIETQSLEQQLRAELAWSQFVRRSFSGRVKVGDQEIEEQYKKAVRAVNQTRFLVSEILLNLDSFSSEQQIAQLSGEIVKQLQSGVDFSAVARQFSIAPTASRGGQLGWITADQLDKRLASTVRQMKPGQVSSPIPTNAGLYIIALADKRAGGNDPSKNQFDVLSLTFAKDTKPSKIDKFVADFKTCRRAQQSAKKAKAAAKRTGLRALSKLPRQIANAVGNLEAGRLASPVTTPDGIELYAVCDRKDDLGIEISRDQISENIFSQRVSMMARRHLRDLRRDAVVEYR